jgi:hypothetical protein
MFTQEVDPAQRKGHDFHMPPLSRWAVPVLFRATPGLHCERNHYTYRTGDGRYYWGQNVSLSGLEVEPTISLEPLTVEHRPNLRPLERLSTKDAYYKRRDRLGIEWPDCDICKTQPSTESVPYDFQAFGEALQAGAVRVCEDCKPEVDKRNRKHGCATSGSATWTPANWSSRPDGRLRGRLPQRTARRSLRRCDATRETAACHGKPTPRLRRFPGPRSKRSEIDDWATTTTTRCR